MAPEATIGWRFVADEAPGRGGRALCGTRGDRGVPAGQRARSMAADSHMRHGGPSRAVPILDSVELEEVQDDCLATPFGVQHCWFHGWSEV